MEDLKHFIESTVQNTIQTTLEPMIERIVKRLLAEQTPVENIVETVLATSELKVLKRISTVETVLGLNLTFRPPLKKSNLIFLFKKFLADYTGS
jgi:hypothetical protein